MKITFIAPGNSIHSKKWIDFFCNNETHEITWISFDKFEYQPSGSQVKLIQLTRNYLLNPRAIATIINACKDADVVQVHSLGFYGLSTLFVKTNNLIGTAWGSDIVFGSAHILRRFLLKVMVKRCRYITCDAKHMTNRLVELGAPEDCVKVINFGVNSNVFHPPKKSYQRKGSYLISTRNFEPVYDVQTIVKAFSKVRELHSDYKLLLVGSGSLGRELQELVYDLGLVNSVEFTGRISQEELVSLLGHADLYISTSLSDGGIAASTAEAMLCKTAVIISDVGDNADWIDHGINGLLYEAGNAEALAKTIISALETPDNIDGFASLGRQTILERNEYHNEMQKVEKLYDLVNN